MTLSLELDPLLEKFSRIEGSLLPLLHGIQAQYGYIPVEAEPAIAKALNLSNAEVRGVLSFYHDFRSTAPGKHQIKICCAEACQARGGRALSDYVKARLNVDYGETTTDGLVTVDKVYCLGNCSCGPSVAVADEVYANMDASRFDALLAELGVEVGQ
ncbi:MAG: formate dehydrogenase subunit gamma [Porticoccaceae bacterium]|nr:formate dehydrogenase subunit gamma [Porticoccaceae bacterium]